MRINLPFADRLPVLSLLSGLLLFLAWPPFPLAFLLFFAFVPLLYGTDLILSRYNNRFPMRRAWLFGYASIFIWNLLTTWWVSLSTLPGGIFALLVNTLIMTFPYLMFVWTRRKVGTQASWFMLIAMWISYEYFHMRWELTWPWLTLGNGFAEQHRWIQWYEYTGAYGGTLWIWIANILLYKTFLKPSKLIYPVAAVFVVIVPVLISFSIYTSTDPNSGKAIEVAVLQTDFDPHSEKFDMPAHTVLSTMLELSELAVDSTLDYLVWPETALTESINMQTLSTHPSLNKIRSLRQKYPDLNIITGINAYIRYTNREAAPEMVRTIRMSDGREIYINSYNTAIQINRNPEVQFYHKGKLVPGPERFPYYGQLKWLNKLIPGMENYMGMLSASPKRTNLWSADSVGVATAICYESVFGEFVNGYVRNGADLIFVITNDGWWGDSPGRKQHKSYAKLRAIETRRSVARAANTGISCFIDQRGDVVADAGKDNAQVLRHTMYGNTKNTVYVKQGDAIGRTSIWIAVALFLITFVRAVKDRIKVI